MPVSPEQTVFCACIPSPGWVGRTHLEEVLAHLGKKRFPTSARLEFHACFRHGTGLATLLPWTP